MKNALLKSLVTVSVFAFLLGASSAANAFDDPFAERGTKNFFGMGVSECAAETQASQNADEYFDDKPWLEPEDYTVEYNDWDAKQKCYVCKIKVPFVWHPPPSP